MVLNCLELVILKGGVRRRNCPQKAQMLLGRYQARTGQPIKSFFFLQVGGAGSKLEAVGMFSGDGEYVDFLHSVLLEGPVEVSGDAGLRTKSILLPIRKFTWFHEERTSP